MIKRKVAAQNSVHYGVTSCPREGKQVVPDQQRVYRAAGDTEAVIWWHCPVCGGWHVMKECNPISEDLPSR